jgi:predicted PurR-regulated permease PerM
LGQLGGLMGDAFTIFILALFLLLELDSINLKTLAVLRSSNNTVDYLNKIGKSIRHYLSIKTITSLLTGILIWIGLLIIGVDYAIIWGLIAFLFNYIPNIGSIIAAIPAVLFALVQLGLGGVLWTSVIFVAVNMIIGNAVEPKMMGRGLGLSTFVVFLSLIFWGYILGAVGMFLSVPLTMAIKIILEQSKNTRWLAVILGTRKDAENMLEEQD